MVIQFFYPIWLLLYPGKSDYNLDPVGIWDVWSSETAPWRKRRDGQPFFAFITVGETHEGRINFRHRYEQATTDLPDELKHDPTTVTIPPFYPDTREIRTILAGMYDLATVFDREVGEDIEWLKDNGDLDDTIVFVFGDHGNGLPRYKRWLNDSGLRVPLVVHVPHCSRCRAIFSRCDIGCSAASRGYVPFIG